MAALSSFSDVLENELNALIQKVIPEKTKIARKYDIKIFKVRKKWIWSVKLEISLQNSRTL